MRAPDFIINLACFVMGSTTAIGRADFPLSNVRVHLQVGSGDDEDGRAKAREDRSKSGHLTSDITDQPCAAAGLGELSSVSVLRAIMAFVGAVGSGSAASASRRMVNARGVVCARKAHAARSVVMQTGNGGADRIDFADVDVQEAGKEFQGMVFQPEDGGTVAVATRCRVLLSDACEEALNNQINVEYTASYAYHALSAYFGRDTVALPGFAKYFKEESSEERSHAQMFIDYQNSKGGRVQFKPIAVPTMHFENLDGTSDALYAMDLHLQLEKFVYKKLMDVWNTADEAKDPEMTQFVEDMLAEQRLAVKKSADFVAQLRRIGTGHGIWHFDRELAEAN
ncbi:Ferritin-1, chloroplastic [Porphyridium purpureum]|uniref:Ferritin n=1 Tax=Porphyridium purpureum TaxID=35688 RepID=A0A5J4Z7Q2_PORPP|nr:Ferritin-1, chloroplastic [Porphyridium purpureum]|eukprot:POR9464..scf295_1